MPIREHRSLRARHLRIAAGSALLLTGALSTSTAIASGSTAPSNATSSLSCAASLGGPNQWHPVLGPMQARPPRSVEQLDSDPCVMILADADGKRWRSDDAGGRWRPVTDSAAVTRVSAERLQVNARGRWLGPVLGTSSDSGSKVPTLFFSHDAGRSFQPAQLATSSGTVPMQATLLSAATGTRIESGNTRTVVYAVVSPRTASTDIAVGTAGTTLLRSDDDGQTYKPVSAHLPSAESLTALGTPAPVPTVVAVNPVVQDEVWVNSVSTGTVGGGAWVSYNGGTTFSRVCCDDPAVSVHDIDVGTGSGGNTVVLLATNKGLLRSADGGTSGNWHSVSQAPASAVRAAPDNPSTALVTTSTGVRLSTGAQGGRLRTLRGLPRGCRPDHLRRTDTVPATYLVDCAAIGSTYRLTLTDYPSSTGDTGRTSVQPPLVDPAQYAPGVPRPMLELVTWRLPQWRGTSSAIAFDGVNIYYDLASGAIARINARTGAFVGTFDRRANVKSMSFDLRHNALLVSDKNGKLKAINAATNRLRSLGAWPYKVPSYDAHVPGLSWVDENGTTLKIRALRGDTPGIPVCSGPIGGPGGTSTYVAAGDGGGYVQSEDDKTVQRINQRCEVIGTYIHRAFSESDDENDAMACDTQTFFPQPVIWIRDAQPGTVSAYAVPSGYCPMPSKLVLSAAKTIVQGVTTSLCVNLTNDTTKEPAANRPVTVKVADAVVGHGTTDEAGDVCLPWTAPTGLTSPITQKIDVLFSGDSALYPSSDHGVIKVLASLPAPPTNPAPPVVAAGPPPPPPVPEVPPVQVPNVGPAPAQAQAPAPNLGQAPQAQGQTIAAAVAVPQRQSQAQLALAQATVDLDTGNAMVAAKARTNRSLPFDPAPTAALLGISCVVTATVATSLARSSAGSTPRRRRTSATQHRSHPHAR